MYPWDSNHCIKMFQHIDRRHAHPVSSRVSLLPPTLCLCWWHSIFVASKSMVYEFIWNKLYVCHCVEIHWPTVKPGNFQNKASFSSGRFGTGGGNIMLVPPCAGAAPSGAAGVSGSGATEGATSDLAGESNIVFWLGSKLGLSLPGSRSCKYIILCDFWGEDTTLRVRLRDLPPFPPVGSDSVGSGTLIPPGYSPVLWAITGAPGPRNPLHHENHMLKFRPIKHAHHICSKT